MFQPNVCKLNQALLSLLLVTLLVDYTEPSYNAKSIFSDIEEHENEAIQARNIDFDNALALLTDYGKVISHEDQAKRLEVLQNSYNLLKGESLRGNVSRVMINFLYNGIQVSNDTKELKTLLDQTQNTIETEKKEAFPRKPNFFERLFGINQKRGPYDNFDLSKYNLFGTGTRTDKPEKDVNNSPENTSSNDNPTEQPNSADNQEVTSTTTPAPQKSGLEQFQDFLGLFG